MRGARWAHPTLGSPDAAVLRNKSVCVFLVPEDSQLTAFSSEDDLKDASVALAASRGQPAGGFLVEVNSVEVTVCPLEATGSWGFPISELWDYRNGLAPKAAYDDALAATLSTLQAHVGALAPAKCVLFEMSRVVTPAALDGELRAYLSLTHAEAVAVQQRA